MLEKIESDIGWFLWENNFSTNLKNKIGLGGTPIVYVICEDTSARWEPAIDATRDLKNYH